MKSHLWRVDIEDYEPLSGEEAVERILHKAHRLRGLRELNVSSTFYGGGVAELLSSAASFHPAATGRRRARAGARIHCPARGTCRRAGAGGSRLA